MHLSAYRITLPQHFPLFRNILLSTRSTAHLILPYHISFLFSALRGWRYALFIICTSLLPTPITSHTSLCCAFLFPARPSLYLSPTTTLIPPSPPFTPQHFSLFRNTPLPQHVLNPSLSFSITTLYTSFYFSALLHLSLAVANLISFYSFLRPVHHLHAHTSGTISNVTTGDKATHWFVGVRRQQGRSQCR